MRNAITGNTSLLWLASALFAVSLAAGCTDGDGTITDSELTPSVKCCSCVCADADGQVCGTFDSTTSLTDSCNQICDAQCGATLGCQDAMQVDACSVDPGGKKDDPCTRTCNITAKCGVSLYADEGTCEETCQDNPTAFGEGVANCLDASGCFPDIVAYCLENIEWPENSL